MSKLVCLLLLMIAVLFIGGLGLICVGIRDLHWVVGLCGALSVLSAVQLATKYGD